MASILRKFINIFILIRIFYWHSIVAIFNLLIGKAKQIQAEWATLNFNYLKVIKKQLQGSYNLKQGKLIVYANHRSQSDFFLHNVITNFQTNFLSRMAVLIASPFFIASTRTVWFFNRGKKTQPEKFNQWLDNKFSQSTRPALLAYPQGHRMQGATTVDKSKIKTGMIKYAYRRKIPSQILMTFGNEQIFDQKRLHVGWNKTVYYKFSEVIDPSEFGSQEQYVNKIKQRFCQFFQEVYTLFEKQKQKQKQREVQKRMDIKLID